MDHDETRPWKVSDPPECVLNTYPEPKSLPVAFCAEVGRKLLLAELEFSKWVPRRIEQVDFVRDRSATRRITIQLNVREDAPVFRDLDGQECWLVPLSLMRRKTLVDLKLRDEHGGPLTRPGILLTQQLDQSVVLAAAAAEPGSLTRLATIQEFVGRLISGGRDGVLECADELDDLDVHLRNAMQNQLFKAAVHEFRLNFTLYVFLPKTLGRHRTVTMSFDEPTDWSYQTPLLNDKERDGVWVYRTRETVGRLRYTRIASALGWRPMRVRFQVPAAENAASYHFEFVAPHGLRIVDAELLAGRPNVHARDPSVDHVVGHAPVIALHAVDIPHGSLCRAQVDLRIRSGGWLTTMLWCSLAVFVFLCAVALSPSRWQDPNFVRDIVVLLVATSAAVATLVVERESSGAAARLVTKLRFVGAGVALLPVFVATILVYELTEKARDPHEQLYIDGLWVLALSLLLLILVAWICSALDERANRHADDSPSDHTNKQPLKRFKNYEEAMREYGFDKPAIGIRSSEGWHERYEWTDDLQDLAIEALSPPSARSDWCAVFGVRCSQAPNGKKGTPAQDGTAGLISRRGVGIQPPHQPHAHPNGGR